MERHAFEAAVSMDNAADAWCFYCDEYEAHDNHKRTIPTASLYDYYRRLAR